MAGLKGRSGRRPKEEDIELIERLTPLDDQAFNLLKEGIEKGDFRFLKLYFNYRFGRARQQRDLNITSDKETPIFKINWVTSEYQENQ